MKHTKGKWTASHISEFEFDIIDENTSHLNFMFDVVFFLPISIVKQIFIGTIK